MANLTLILSPVPCDLDDERNRTSWVDIFQCKRGPGAGRNRAINVHTDAHKFIKNQYAAARAHDEDKFRTSMESLPGPFWNAIDVAFKEHVFKHMDVFRRMPQAKNDARWQRAMYEYAIDVQCILLAQPPERIHLNDRTRAALVAQVPLSRSIINRAMILIMGDPTNNVHMPAPLPTMSFVEAVAGLFKNVALGVREVSEFRQARWCLIS